MSLFEAARPLRVLFFGSRYGWESLVELHALMRPRLVELPEGSVVIHGDALGADRAAEHVARELVAAGARLHVLRAPPMPYGRASFHLRNQLMASLLDPAIDKAEGFLAGERGQWSAGSADMARILERACITCNAHWLEGAELPYVRT